MIFLSWQSSSLAVPILSGFVGWCGRSHPIWLQIRELSKWAFFSEGRLNFWLSSSGQHYKTGKSLGQIFLKKLFLKIKTLKNLLLKNGVILAKKFVATSKLSSCTGMGTQLFSPCCLPLVDLWCCYSVNTKMVFYHQWTNHIPVRSIMCILHIDRLRKDHYFASGCEIRQ